jgi:hypothetical protein
LPAVLIVETGDNSSPGTTPMSDAYFDNLWLILMVLFECQDGLSCLLRNVSRY